jgi:hypothetical protein
MAADGVAALGFGRFSLAGRPLLPEARRQVDRRARASAGARTRGFPGLRSSGTQLLVLSRKTR